MRAKFLYWRNIKNVVPHKYMDLQLFKKEGFLFQQWIAYQGLTDFVQMKGHCYPDLVKVFYTNLRVVNGVIHSRVKGFNITIDDNLWLDIAGLKVEGLDSHFLDSESNRWLTKRAICINCLRYPGRLNEDKMSIEDVFLLNAIKTRIPTNWVAVLKHHMIAAGDDYAHKLPYGVFITKVLELQGVDVSEEERRIVCQRSEEIGIPCLSSIGLKKIVNGWFFIDEQTVRSPPTLDQDHTEDSDDEDSMESS
ncbi:hypothetical protein LR48_Vigan07g161100 [Vigna angularis]|uniref:Putative plant transposon protein domain-containing protein n=1 Tax=Phaseolus angularis TaxID=3914 RepID=A0A0L9UZ91_PHAAN|nr:hypothetical protein LR48_Vigan07g161100 [Vigna angularis]